LLPHTCVCHQAV